MKRAHEETAFYGIGYRGIGLPERRDARRIAEENDFHWMRRVDCDLNFHSAEYR
jgi:hypothetical protein